jgi:hypothetical protein
MTVEGYTFGRGDSSYWLDPSLSEVAWPTVPRPAVVLQVSRNWRGKVIVKLAPITRRQLDDSVPHVLLAADGDSREIKVATVSGSGWLQGATWAYTFMHTASFTCNPDQVGQFLIPNEARLIASRCRPNFCQCIGKLPKILSTFCHD